MYLIRGLKADSAEVWYTGRAGDGWVSGDKREAFACLTLEGAMSLVASIMETLLFEWI